jgi:D-alanine-D-alanine ligase
MRRQIGFGSPTPHTRHPTPARGIALSLTLSVATKNGAKPTITILYDADEDRVRAEALAKKEKFPALVSVQIEEVLTKRGYTVKRLAAEPPVKKLVRLLEDDNSDLIFNVCESLGGNGGEERRIAAVLELLDKRFTGSGSLSLTLAGDKSLSKKLFEFHGVRSPEFTIISTTGTEGKPSLDKFPLIVKPIASDASIGINAKSVVKTVEELMERVFAIHQEFHTPALVEEYIDGRELYVGILGNPPALLPPIEWDLSKLPDHLPRIAGTEAKWENDFKDAKEFVPQDVIADEALMMRISEAALGACKALLIRDYARIDMRLAADGTPYVIEVNPNPWLDGRAEFAMAARRGKPELSFGDLVEKIIELAMTHEIHDRSVHS